AAGGPGVGGRVEYFCFKATVAPSCDQYPAIREPRGRGQLARINQRTCCRPGARCLGGRREARQQEQRQQQCKHSTELECSFSKHCHLLESWIASGMRRQGVSAMTLRRAPVLSDLNPFWS